MTDKIRNIFPGGNTPEGFFSYYTYILGQQEANRILCLKGGPGVGKSTFMKKIGQHFAQKGEAVDFLWCSSDPDSLDGIVLRERKIAVIDATSPHVVDPVNPGAVDNIVHLGEFWDGEALKKCKSCVMESNARIKEWFSCAYGYLAAAGKVYDTLGFIYSCGIREGELYKHAAEIVRHEFCHKEITLETGRMKKQFASAITPAGIRNHLESILNGCERAYVIQCPVGLDSSRLLNIAAESALYRGMDTEGYYCPMKPGKKLEHLLIPQIKTAFLTLNPYHDLELEGRKEDIKRIDMNDIINWNQLEGKKFMVKDCERKMNELLEQGISCIKEARKEHDLLESYYIPNMDFKKIDALRDEIIGKIEENVL